MGELHRLDDLKARLSRGRTRYLLDWKAGRVGREVHSRSEKDLAPHRPRRPVDPEKVDELRRQGLSWRAVAERLAIGVGTARRAGGAPHPQPAADNRTAPC